MPRSVILINLLSQGLRTDGEQGEVVVSPSTSIFISHVNGDQEAEGVLQALVNGLKNELGPSHDGYELAYDREIIAGKEWRRAIYEWLIDCAAAVILVSQGAFDPDKPWVSHEATALTITQTWRPDLHIIPVLLQGVEPLLNSRPTFKPGRLPALQAFRFPDPPRLDTNEALVKAIAERLKRELPEFGATPLVGLAAKLADALSAFPEPARKAAASVLDPVSMDGGAARLAERLLAADEVKTQQAFYALCDKARDKRFLEGKQVVSHILGAQRVREADAKPIAVEAAKPGASGYGRALLIDSEDPDIVDLYLTRATRRFPHAWDVIDGPSVLEFGHLDDLKKGVRKIIAGRFGSAAGRSEDLQLRRANAVIASKRLGGFPVLLKQDYLENRDSGEALAAIREVCRELMVLYTVAPEALVHLPAEGEVCQIAPLGLHGYDQVIGLYGALIDHCLKTTPEEEASK